MSFFALLDSQVDIKRLSYITDPLGGQSTPVYSILHANVRCRFESLPKKLEIQAYDQSAIFPDYKVYLNAVSGIKEGDRIFLGSKEFEIKLIENWSERGKYMTLHVSELDRGDHPPWIASRILLAIVKLASLLQNY